MGEESKRLKEELAKRLIKATEKVLPDLSQHIVTRDVSTALTYERYTLSSKGALYNVDIAPDRAGDNGLQTKTPIDGCI